jgi:general stress protein 26
MNDIQHFAKLIKDIKFAMFTTYDPNTDEMHSRPMTLQEAEFDGDLWFFADESTEWVSQLERQPRVNLSFANVKDFSFLSAVGTAEIVEDRDKMEQLWRPTYKAWFPKGLEDPKVCLVKVHVESADYWESPNSKVVQLVGFVKAMATGKRADNIGDQGHMEFSRH